MPFRSFGLALQASALYTSRWRPRHRSRKAVKPMEIMGPRRFSMTLRPRIPLTCGGRRQNSPGRRSVVRFYRPINLEATQQTFAYLSATSR
jgi:hypothetical protein